MNMAFESDLSLTFSTKDSNTPLLRIEDVTKVLQNSDSRFQLQIPEMSIYPGEFVAIVGESGCGKSTLLDLLALISAPTGAKHYQLHFSSRQSFNVAGFWEEKNDNSLAGIRQQHLGYILQTGGLLPYLTVEQNLSLPIKIKKGKTNHHDIKNMAERMGVGACLSRLPNALSGGQRQRVAILRALLHHPSLVLADEPTAAVDKQRAVSIVEDFYRLAKDNDLAIFMVTHDIDLVRHIANRVYTFRVEHVGHQETVSTLYPARLQK